MKNLAKFRAVVIGCGKIGAEEENYGENVRPGTHAGVYQMNKKTQLVALVDKDKKKLTAVKKHFPGVNLYTDIESMLKKERPDIISVATPTKCHHDSVLQLAQSKCRAILCEKPITYTINEAQKMINVCEKNNLQLFINHHLHFDFLLQKWSEKIHQGLLGKLYQANLYYYNGLFNNGTHGIDLLRMLFGEPVMVVGRNNTETSSNLKDLNVDGLITFKNGPLVSFQSLSKNYGYFGLKIFGEEGMLDIINLGFQIQYRKKIKNKNYKRYFGLSENTFEEGGARSMLFGAIDHVVTFLEGKTKPISTGRDGLAVLRILMAIKKSANLGGKKIYF